MTKPLVSIVTPCYNGENHLDAYFDCILSQDYENCELIFMNDGSTDNSEKIVERYRESIEKKGYILHYYFHSNVGLAQTIHRGFQHVTGEYVIWPDCDDLIAPNSISKKVQFLEEHPDYGAVRTDGVVINEGETEPVRFISRKLKSRFDEELFDSYLVGNGFMQPICFMIRVSALDAANPGRYFYAPVGLQGQDWQILLPIFYKYKCGFIDESLCTYILHSRSLSATANKKYETLVKRQQIYETIVLETIKHMEIDDYDKYASVVHGHFCQAKIDVLFEHYRRKEAINQYNDLKKFSGGNIKYALKAYLANSKCFHAFVRLTRKYLNS